MAKLGVIHVQVVWVDALNQIQEKSVQLHEGACLKDALQTCGLALNELHAFGVWGRQKPSVHPLQEGDRVEVYQPLKVDPKVARRERFAQQGARGAGLFARRREHSKAGY